MKCELYKVKITLSHLDGEPFKYEAYTVSEDVESAREISEINAQLAYKYFYNRLGYSEDILQKYIDETQYVIWASVVKSTGY